MHHLLISSKLEITSKLPTTLVGMHGIKKVQICWPWNFKEIGENGSRKY